MPFVKGYKWTDRQRGECGFRKGITPWNKGKKGVYSEDLIREKSLAWQGRISPMKGKKHSQSSINKIKESLINLNRKGTHRVITWIPRGPKGKPWSLARRIAQERRNGLPYRKSIRSIKRCDRKPLIKNGKEYSPNWQEIRKQIYQRDGWICQECGIHCHNKQQIQCHHINYDTSDNVFSNLITLCSSCHAKTNWRRDNWTKHYENLLRSRGLVSSEN
jgi:hypothetical protein